MGELWGVLFDDFGKMVHVNGTALNLREMWVIIKWDDGFSSTGNQVIIGAIFIE